MSGSMARAIVAGILLGACGRGKPTPVAGTSSLPSPIQSSDSLVLTIDSAQVWLTAGRPDTAPAGSTCVERVMEIRRGGRIVKVPLLYTIGSPARLDDSTIRAALFRHCEPSAWYHVSTRTGQVEREHP